MIGVDCPLHVTSLISSPVLTRAVALVISLVLLPLGPVDTGAAWMTIVPEPLWTASGTFIATASIAGASFAEHPATAHVPSASIAPATVAAAAGGAPALLATTPVATTPVDTLVATTPVATAFGVAVVG